MNKEKEAKPADTTGVSVKKEMISIPCGAPTNCGNSLFDEVVDKRANLPYICLKCWQAGWRAEGADHEKARVYQLPENERPKKVTW